MLNSNDAKTGEASRIIRVTSQHRVPIIMHNKKTICPFEVGFTGLMNMDRLDLARWCRDNCKGDYYYKYTNLGFYFQYSKDAVQFKKHRDKLWAWQVLSA